MTEMTHLKKGIIKLVCVGVCGLLYCLGGLEGGGGLWVRRFLMPIFFTGTLYYFSRNWKSLITLPLFILTLTLGYGTDNLITKVIRRAIFGFSNGATSTSFNISKKEYLLSFIHIALMVTLYIGLGVWNPLPNSAIEQLALGSALVFLPIMSAK